MKQIKKLTIAGLTAFAMATMLPMTSQAADIDSVCKTLGQKNMVLSQSNCKLEDVKGVLEQVAAKGDCFQWSTIIVGNNNSNGNQGAGNNAGANGEDSNNGVQNNGNSTDNNETVDKEESQEGNINCDENNPNLENGGTNESIPNNKPESGDENTNQGTNGDTDSEEESNNGQDNNNEQENDQLNNGQQNNGGAVQKPESEGEVTESSYAKQVLSLVNVERAKEGLAPLTWNTQSSQAAMVRGKEIQTSFSHTRPNGSNFATALRENGVSYRSTGENIAWGQRTPEQVMNAWMNSPGHRANIMNKNFTSIGVGYVQNSSGTPYWVQLFTY